MKIFNLILSSCLLVQSASAYSILKPATPAKPSASDEIEPSTTSRRNMLRSAAALSAGALLANINAGVALADDDIATPVYFGVGVSFKRCSATILFSFALGSFRIPDLFLYIQQMNHFLISASGTSNTSLSFREKRIFWAENPANTHLPQVTLAENLPTRKDVYAITTFRELRIMEASGTEKWLV